jgi:hypothetical protein
LLDAEREEIMDQLNRRTKLPGAAGSLEIAEEELLFRDI